MILHRKKTDQNPYTPRMNHLHKLLDTFLKEEKKKSPLRPTASSKAPISPSFPRPSFNTHPPTYPKPLLLSPHIKANSPRMSLLSQTLRRSTLQLHLLPSRSALVALSPRLPSSHHSRFYATPSSPSPSTSTSTPSAASSPPPNTPISLQGKGVQEEVKHENAKLFSKQDTLSYRDLLLIFSETITQAVSVHLLYFLPNKRNPKGLKEMGGRRELEEEGRRRG